MFQYPSLRIQEYEWELHIKSLCRLPIEKKDLKLREKKIYIYMKYCTVQGSTVQYITSEEE